MVAGGTLWKTHTSRFSLALVAITLPTSIVISGVFAAWLFWPTFSVTTFVISMVVSGFIVGLIALLSLIVQVDAPGSTFLKLPLQHIECFEHGASLRDASGELLGDLSAGTLRVVRTNMMHGRGLVGAVALEHAGGTTWVVPYQLLGAWSGMRAVAHSQQAHRIEDPLFNALLKLAE
ncbi:hypothetical protein [Pyxidicoccus sp. MSG2]|uniref:hypothetical protein n=1 Tax=Pyxidicoccus sp. MSG2 TaxID=2996790 RepID=UPI00226FAAEE|nr:hypothetical protein [Pyxidicoccus sp. MSG2]MCY1020109.1 hypothetical protein [Pyxidicoccus sp. MSG2]